MKRLLFILLALTLLIANLISCSETETIDYTNITDFEAALNNGDDLTGKSVTFEVKEFVPDSAFGYNMQAGEYLNFCSFVISTVFELLHIIGTCCYN